MPGLRNWHFYYSYVFKIFLVKFFCTKNHVQLVSQEAYS